MMMMRLRGVLVASLWIGCVDLPATARDASVEAAFADASTVDIGAVTDASDASDASAIDVSVADVAAGDVPAADAGDVHDARVPDDAPTVADAPVSIDQPNPLDVAGVDVGIGDLGPSDAGAPDGSPPDTGTGDLGTTCATGQTICDGACVSTATDPAHCGGCTTACARANATASCTAGTCAYTCLDGFFAAAADCVPIAAPRQISPLSGAVTTSRRPVLSWISPDARIDGARVELCLDRACTMPVAGSPFEITGSTFTPPAALPAGQVVFWRLRGRAGARTGAATAVSRTWEFVVGGSSSPRSTSWGTVPDFNGDGRADVAVGASQAFGMQGAVDVYYSDPLRGGTGLPGPPDATLRSPVGTAASFGINVRAAPDVNGDGFPDLLVGSNGSQSAYIYFGSPTGLSTEPGVSLLRPATAATCFGLNVAGVGDVNRDGYGDVVVGTYGCTIGALLYLGGPAGPTSAPALTLASAEGVDSSFGFAIVGGDANGDGYSDVIISAFRAGSGGRAYEFLGGPTGPSPAPSRRLDNPDSGGNFGYSLAVADLNGDGVADLTVSNYDSTVGHAHVYLGVAPSGLGSASDLDFVGPSADGNGFATNVAGVGDVNGDGFEDLFVANYVYSSPASRTGRGYLYLGPITGSAPTPNVTLSNPDGFENAYFGISAGGGDVNGDGLSDLIVGSYGASELGVVRVYLGARLVPVLTQPAASTLNGPHGTHSYFGASVAGAFSTH